jgi:threonine aldolase
VNKLEQEIAILFDKESAIYMASGTMANLIAVMVHCRKKGESVIMGSACHINNYEGGGISSIANVMSSIIPN